MKHKKSIMLLLLLLCVTAFSSVAHAENWFRLSRYSLTLYMGEGCKKIVQYCKYDDMTIYCDSRNAKIAKVDWTKTRHDDEIWYIKPVGVGTTYLEFEDDYGDTRTCKVTVKPMRAAGILKTTKISEIYYGDNRISGKTVPGAKVSFKIRGKKYSVKANSKGKFTIAVKSVKSDTISFTIKIPSGVTAKKTVSVS